MWAHWLISDCNAAAFLGRVRASAVTDVMNLLALGKSFLLAFLAKNKWVSVEESSCARLSRLRRMRAKHWLGASWLKITMASKVDLAHSKWSFFVAGESARFFVSFWTSASTVWKDLLEAVKYLKFALKSGSMMFF